MLSGAVKLPFFSIITATYDAAIPLPGLLESLADQRCRDFELVLQDGHSTDNTVALVESYRHRLPSLKLQSTPDTGIYDAWNRALDRVAGQWVLFLGADDALAGPDVLDVVAKKLIDAPSGLLYASGDVEMISPKRATSSRIAGRSEGVRELLKTYMPFANPGLFYRASLFSKQRFDTNFHICGDYEFVCRTWLDDHVGMNLETVVTRMAVTGLSNRPRSILLGRWESANVAARHFTGTWTQTRLLGLAKGMMHYAVCRCFGPTLAPILLDRLRVIRGLPPVWEIRSCPEAKRVHR